MSDVISRALKIIFSNAKRLEIYCAYGGAEWPIDLFAGLDEVKGERAKGNLMRPILIYGFDPEERIRGHESGSILDAPGIFYLRLPAHVKEIEKIVEKATHTEIPVDQAIDEKSLRDYAVKNIRAYKHRLDNMCASMEMNANRARKEFERFPDLLPKSLLEFKSGIIHNLLSEYNEHKGMIVKLGITDSNKIPEMMKELLGATREIEDRATARSDALDLAFRSVELGRTISNILEQVKEL